MNIKVVRRWSSGTVMVNRSQPLADQVYQELLDWVQSTQADGNQSVLPSETELSEMFSTSRATIREALAWLERERIVIRRQGSGTFISPAFPKLSNTINKLNDPLLMIGGNGITATLGKVDYSLTPLSEASARRLEIEPGDQAVRLDILYLLEKTPAAELEAVIPTLDVYQDSAALPPFTSLMRFALDISGWKVTHCITTLRAVGTTERQANLLQLSVGQPLLAMDELFLTDFGNPAFHATLYLLSDKVELNLLRNSDETGNRISIW